MKSRPSALKVIFALFFLFLPHSLLARNTKQSGNQSSSAASTISVLRYDTYLGRTPADIGHAVAVGADGSIYVAGLANPTTASGHKDAFVAHLSSDGSTVLYLVYLGGNDDTEARAIALDSAGNLYITGETHALNFPLRNAVQSRCSLNSAQQCAGN